MAVRFAYGWQTRFELAGGLPIEGEGAERRIAPLVMICVLANLADWTFLNQSD